MQANARKVISFLQDRLFSLQTTISLARRMRECRSQNRRGRSADLDSQQHRLQELLLHAWDNCPFYRQHWSIAGIDRNDLRSIPVEHLPTVSKPELQDAFDDVVTGLGVNLSGLRRLVHENPDPTVPLVPGYLVITTSGTSGPGGLFVYSEHDWRQIQAVVGARRKGSLRPRLRRERVAAVVATHNRFAGATFAANLPDLLFKVRLFPAENSTGALVKELNAFRPDVLTGYSSAIHALAQVALASRELDISPKSVSVSGDMLTESMERAIVQAWEVPVRQSYVCTEGVLLAERFTGETHFSVTDDLNIVEILDELDRPAAEGKTGRVVITNLYNRVMPIIRYELGDLAVRAHLAPDATFSALSDLRGRVSDPLPLRLEDGQLEYVQVSALWSVYDLSPRQVQFCWRDPGTVRIDYVSTEDLDDAIRGWFANLLKSRRATRTQFLVNRVACITPEPTTGKVQATRQEK